jgi:hypothetical protein
MWADINCLHLLSAHVDEASKNYYPQMRMRIVVLEYADTVIYIYFILNKFIKMNLLKMRKYN